MNPAFVFPNYVIKPQGLAIGGKYRLYDPQNKPILHIEYKTPLKGPHDVLRACTDEKRTRPVLGLVEAGHPEYVNFLRRDRR